MLLAVTVLPAPFHLQIFRFCQEAHLPEQQHILLLRQQRGSGFHQLPFRSLRFDMGTL